jgi:hypothetical protein
MERMMIKLALVVLFLGYIGCVIVGLVFGIVISSIDKDLRIAKSIYPPRGSLDDELGLWFAHLFLGFGIGGSLGSLLGSMLGAYLVSEPCLNPLLGGLASIVVFGVLLYFPLGVFGLAISAFISPIGAAIGSVKLK